MAKHTIEEQIAFFKQYIGANMDYPNVLAVRRELELFGFQMADLLAACEAALPLLTGRGTGDAYFKVVEAIRKAKGEA